MNKKMGFVNRDSCIDSMRVMAAILIIISHYGYMYTTTRLGFIPNFYGGAVGQIGVGFFFFVSGYLSFISISGKKISGYYLDKVVRIIIPYVFTYFFMSALFIALSLFNKDLINTVPLVSIIKNSGSYISVVPVFFAMDGILNSYFSTSYLSFTGEWFIGCVIFIYIVSPVFYFLVEKFTWLFSLIMMLVIFFISLVVFCKVQFFIKTPFWFFVCRLPEFVFGMVVCKYKNYLCSLRCFLLSFFVCVVSWLFIGSNEIKFDTTNDQLMVIPLMSMSFMAFVFFSVVNKRLDLSLFNSKSKYIYVCMLVQHVIIYRVMSIFDLNDISVFGYVFLLIVIFYLVLFVSKIIFVRTSAIESFFWSKINKSRIYK